MTVKKAPVLKPIISHKYKNEDKVVVPLVITKERDGYHGFVPGIVMKDIISHSKDEVTIKLKDFAKEQISAIRRNGEMMPLFPSNEEIKQDFNFVVRIERITC